ncbi:MAG: hypothetical protein K2P81_01170 [Bacteriovoracaceae bacterium]|nr:hypothetical protein [Bacteriovoracaceae bacterium]
MSQIQSQISQTPTPKDELGLLLTLAAQGHLPLFHKEWIRDSFTDNRRLSFARASRIVEEGMKKLERHQSWSRKQTALGALTTADRREFIQSFFKMVEYKALDQLKELH